MLESIINYTCDACTFMFSYSLDSSHNAHGKNSTERNVDTNLHPSPPLDNIRVMVIVWR